MLPTTSVPAVICVSSAAVIVNVAAPPILIDLLPLGAKVTVPFPALMLPVITTSLADIEMGLFVDETMLDPPIVAAPVPLVVIETPVVPAAEAFKVIPLFVDVAVLIFNKFADKALLVVIVLDAEMSSVPPTVTVPLVPNVLAAVVVTV